MEEDEFSACFTLTSVPLKTNKKKPQN